MPMDLPAPAPLASRPTAAIGCLDGYFPSGLLREVCDAGFAPVFLHRLSGVIGGAGDGPREMLAATLGALGKAGPLSAWGAGCAIRTAEEAAFFATAGYTWFSFDLAGLMDDRADTMSPDQLDAAIVMIEDSGCYPQGWHEHHLDREWRTRAGETLRLGDEALARAAVKFGPALAHADQMHQAIRPSWAGRGGPPDVELHFAARRAPASAEEFLFLAIESARRGLNPAAIAPSLGPVWQPGAEFTGNLGSTLGRFAEIAALCGSLKTGVHFAAGKTGFPSGKAGLPAAAHGIPGGRLHLDFEEATWLERLGQMADTQPAAFREWLRVAQEIFAFAVGDMPLAITEEDTRALPQVADSGLRETFLGHVQGRQLLVATFMDVLQRLGLAAP